MSESKEVAVWLDRAKFFEVGRVLQKNWHRSDLGFVSLTVSHCKLTIMSKRGGAEIDCDGVAMISAKLTASEFRKLIISYRHGKAPTGRMQLVFRLEFGEIAIDVAGVKANFD
jgi:hypothetical protein